MNFKLSYLAFIRYQRTAT